MELVNHEVVLPSGHGPSLAGSWDPLPWRHSTEGSGARPPRDPPQRVGNSQSPHMGNLQPAMTAALLGWHREKAGTVEPAHHVLKNELAAAALPSGKFGANAAWFRLNVLTYNLLTALKRLTLPGDLRTARPKRLRFLLFNTVGKVVAHARKTLLRLSGVLQHALLVRARRKILRLAPAWPEIRTVARALTERDILPMIYHYCPVNFSERCDN